jgi:RHS repeat-associated protein
MRYKPCPSRVLREGENRLSSGTTPTDYHFTGQREEITLGLYFYNARWYDSSIGRFVQADTIVPNPGDPRAFDRYSYVLGNPVRYSDPSGYRPECGVYVGECKSNSTNLSSNINTNSKTSSNSRIDRIESVVVSDEPNPFLSSSPNNESTPKLKSQCTNAHPCLSAWEQPYWWNMNPKHPDYYVLSASAGNGIGGTAILVVDRYGNVYFGIGGNVGKSISPATGSLNGGWIGSSIDDKIPDSENTEKFLAGLSVNGQIGAVGDGAITWSPFAGNYINHTAVEYGGVLPFSIGVSATFSIKIIDGYTIFRRQP